jgi:hypothetical protein
VPDKESFNNGFTSSHEAGMCYTAIAQELKAQHGVCAA